jgi:hypothetical protein
MTFDGGQRIRRLPHFSVQANPLRRLERLHDKGCWIFIPARNFERIERRLFMTASAGR